MGNRIRVLSPVGEVRAAAFVAPGLPTSLEGRTVGFLDNTKANFDRLVGDMGGLLRERFGVSGILHRRKANVAIPAPRQILEELAKHCDVVFAGSAD
jgi:hypothetical protein